MTNQTPDPYRILFPVGVGLGAIGVLLWPLYTQGLLGFFPREAHSNLMFFGLMMAFVSGFLMTAVPKMTGTFPAAWVEILGASFLALLQAPVNLTLPGGWAVGLFSAQILFLLACLARRFLRNPVLPFSGFIFLPAAFLQALLGVAVFFLSDGNRRDAVTLLSSEAFLANLILGLGSRLVPVISRLPNALMPDQRSAVHQWTPPVTVLVLVNSSYWLEMAGFSPFLAGGLRLLGFGFAAVKLLGLLENPVSWSAIGVGLKGAVTLLLLGEALRFVAPASALAALHLTYIGGFSLVTFLISTRVMLAHGGADLHYEVGSPRVWAMGGLFAGAAMARFMAGANFTSPWILLSVTLFLSGAGLWTHKFFLLLRRPPTPDQC